MNFLIVIRRHSHFKKNGNASVQGNLDVAVPEGRRKDRLPSQRLYAFISRHHLPDRDRRECWEISQGGRAEIFTIH